MAPSLLLRNAARRGFVALTLALGVVPLGAPAGHAATSGEIAQATDDAREWLLEQQQPSGAFGVGFGADYAPSAIAAAGIDLATTQSEGGVSAREYVLNAYGPSLTSPLTRTASGDYVNANQRNFGSVTWAALTLHAAGIDPQRVAADQNAIAQLANAYRRGGVLGPGGSNFAAFGLLALNRVGAPALIRQQVVAYLRSQQLNEGSWSIATISDANRHLSGGAEVTGAVLAALCEAGVPVSDAAVSRGFTYLRARQLERTQNDGGIGATGNAETAAWVLAGLNGCYADGRTEAQSGAWTAPSGATLIDYLIAQQIDSGDDQGAYRNPAGHPDIYATQNVLRALAGETFSADPPSRAPVIAPPVGTSSPHAVIVDYGGGLIEFCSASVPIGAPASALLAVLPDRCRPHPGDGLWRAQIEEGPANDAGLVSVGFGDTVTLARIPGTGIHGPVGEQATVTVPPPPAPPVGPPPPPGPPTVVPPESRKPAKPKLGRVKVRCTVNRAKTRLTCTPRSKALRHAKPGKARVTLTRGGRTYAKGTLKRLKRTRKLKRGTYTLRITSLGARATVKLR